MAGIPNSAMDSLSIAMKANIIPNQEYLLQGSILDSSLDILVHRLRGLCDNVDEGPETFHDHELVFGLRSMTAGQPLMLHVRRALELPDLPWHLRYLGQVEIGDKSRPSLVRNVIDVSCSSSIVDFLQEMGAKLDHEFVCKGYMFRKGKMKVTLSKLYKTGHMKPPESWEPLSLSHLVELSVLAPQGQDSVGEDIRNFSEQLRPLVQLEKIDYKRLQHV